MALDTTIDTPDEQDFRDQVLVNDLTHHPGDYVREKRQEHEERLEAAEILEGLRALDSGGDGVRWAIARVGDPDPSKNGHLVTWATVQLEADQIRDAFGGGKYYVKGRRSNGDYAGHKTLTIAGDAPRREGGAVSVTPNANGSLTGSGAMSDFLAQQERRDRERQEREDRRSEKREQLILAALPAAATIFAAMFNRPQIDLAGLAAALKPPPQPAPPDPLAMIAALKQLAPAAPAGPGPMEQALQLFEVLSDKAGANGARTDWLDVVKEGVKILGPSVGGAIESTITQAREHAAQAAAHPAPAPADAPAALPAPGAAHGSPADNPHGDPAMLDLIDLMPHIPWLKAQLQKMSTAAQRGRDPELYAAMFLEELPPGLTPERIHQLLSRSDWLNLLARFDPHVPAHTAWWGKARECIVAFIVEARTPEPPPRSNTGEVDRPAALPSLTGD